MVEKYAPKDLFAVVMDAKQEKFSLTVSVLLLIQKQEKTLVKSGQMTYIKTRMNLVQHLKHTV